MSLEAAVILAGGHSRRMGQPKALLPLAGRPLIEHLIMRCQREVPRVLVAGCPQPGLYADLSVPVLTDVLPDCGPLGGIDTAIHYLLQVDQSAEAFEASIACIPCDGIDLPEHFFSIMEQTLAGHELVFARDSEGDHYLYCALRMDLGQSLRAYLQQGRRRVVDWMRTRDYAVVDFGAEGFRFSNLNTPEDWYEFRR
jgi:molybdopterin-guanine dinucleotide biosynthesis protein A